MPLLAADAASLNIEKWYHFTFLPIDTQLAILVGMEIGFSILFCNFRTILRNPGYDPTNLMGEPNKSYQANRVRSCLLIDPSATKDHSCGGRNPCYGPTYLMGEPNKCYKASHVRSCLLIDPSASKGHYCGGRESSQISKL